MSERPPPFVKFGYGATEQDFYSRPDRYPAPEEIANELTRLLETAKREEEVQGFFERYPHALPGLGNYHHGPMGRIIVTKMPLGTDFVTDFAFVTADSQSIEMVCVEIEAPQKRIFLRDGSFSRDYLNAKQQLADWNFWAQNHLRDVMDLFGPLGRYLPHYRPHVSLQSILVMGRRSHIRTRKQQERWSAEAALRAISMDTMTYDRVVDDIRSGPIWPVSQRLLVCSYGDREFKVQRVAI